MTTESVLIAFRKTPFWDMHDMQVGGVRRYVHFRKRFRLFKIEYYWKLCEMVVYLEKIAYTST